MILSLRGACGSGKSTLARAVVETMRLEQRVGGGNSRQTGRIFRAPWSERMIFVPGADYTPDGRAGGLDSWQKELDEIYQFVKAYGMNRQYHVFYEGACTNDNVRRLCELSALGLSCAALFLATPPHECRRRMCEKAARRGATMKESRLVELVDRVAGRMPRDVVRLRDAGVQVQVRDVVEVKNIQEILR